MDFKRGSLLIAIVLIFASISLIYADNLTDLTASNFNNGTYANTTYNGSAVLLSGNNLSGIYTSRVFDATATADWNNISFIYKNHNMTNLFAVDGNADVWISYNKGINWTAQTLDHGAAPAGVVDLEINDLDNYLYLSVNQDLYRSVDFGVSWSLINDDFNLADGNDAVSLKISPNGTIYLIDASEDVFRSVNSGVNFTNLVDFNGASGSNALGVAINDSGAIFIVDVSAGVFRSVNSGVSWSNQTNDYGGTSGTDSMAVDRSGNLYILLNKAIYKSTNQGVNWTVINNSFSSYAQDGNRIIYSKSINTLFIIDNSGRVFNSSNEGVSWLEVGDINGGSSATPRGLTSSYLDSNISFQLRNCSSSNCADGVFVGPDGTSNSFFTNSENSLNSSFRGRYFQYRVYFTSDVVNLSSQLNNVTIGYSLFDIVNPNLTIISPGNQSYNNSTLLVNISASDNNAVSSVWFYNGSANITYVSPDFYNFNQGSNTLIAYANDSVNNINTASITFIVDSIAPNLNLIHPQTITYGFNTSLPLNFTISDGVSGVNLTSCVYSFNNGLNNISLINCQNTTFNVIGGINQYNLTLFAKDLLNNLVSSNVSFNINTEAPVVNLVFPGNNSYLNYTQNIYFNYTVDSGAGISSCNLYGNFNGNFGINQTNKSLSIGNNFFSLNLSEGTYQWTVACNDTQNRFYQSNNQTLNVDITKPIIVLTEPKNTKPSVSNIPVIISVTDNSPVSCIFNVRNSIGGDIGFANRTIADCTSTNFDLSSDGNYILNLYVNDSAGNTNFTNSTFSISTSSSPAPSSGGGGSSGGGSFAGIFSGNLELTEVNDFIAEPGENRRIPLSVKNTGLSFLNNCRLQAYGLNANWVTPVSETVKIGGGEAHEFYFNLQLPQDLEPASYQIDLSVICSEKTTDTGFSVEILDKKINFELINSSKSGNGEISLWYSLNEQSSLDQNVNIQFILYNSVNEKVAEITETISLEADSQRTVKTIIPVDPSLSGDFNLLINLNSETYSTFIQEEIVIGPGLSGFSIFNNGDAPTIMFFILGVFFLLFVGFMLTRINTLKKKLRKTTDYSNSQDYFARLSIRFNLFRKKLGHKFGFTHSDNFPSGEKVINQI